VGHLYWYTLTVLLIFLFITSYLGYLGYTRTKNAKDFLVAGRETHPLVMALSYGATFISTSAIVGFGGVSAKLGMGVLWLTFLTIFVGIFIAFVFFGKRTRRMGHTLDAHTFPELLGKRFDSKAIQGFSALVIFFFMPIYAAAVIKGGANFIETYFSIPYGVSLFFFVAVVAIYVWMGGMKGVMYTDAFQGVIMFVSMAALLVFAYWNLGGVTEAHLKLTELFSKPDVQEVVAPLVQGGFNGWTSMPTFGSPIWWTLVSTIVMGVGVGVLTQPQLTVRFMTVRSDKELHRAVLSGGIFILFMTGVAFIVGALANALFYESTGKIAIVASEGITDKIIPMFIKTYMPPWFSAIFLISMLAAAMSTLSSMFHTMGSAAGRDLYEEVLNKKGNSVFITRGGVLVVILMSSTIAWMTSLPQFVDVGDAIIAKGTALFFALTAAAFLPAFVGALFMPKMPKAAALWGMVAGFSASFFWNFFVHANAASLQLCMLLTGKVSLVEGTASAKWMMVDSLFVALPASILVTAIVWGLMRGRGAFDLDQAHVAKCFEGIKG
jgi:SSS family solute:Na+ symporter